jgi:hypothetical protein
MANIPDDAFVTVHVSYSVSEADVFCCMLKAYGIPALVHGREVAGNAGHLMVALGGMEIRVPAEHKRDAIQLLAGIEKDTALPESDAFKRRPLLSSLMLSFSVFFGAYVPGWLRKR